MSQPLTANLSGKTAIVTGATAGIGKEVARGLARMGAEVVLAVRSVERGENVRKELIASTSNPRISVMEVDTASPASIRQFAARVEAAHPKVQLLINNAGIWVSERRQSPEGYEATFATNVLGPHLLTQLLTGVLKAGAPARVVNVASGLSGNYDPTDLEFTRRGYNGFKVYSASKTALRMLTWGQARRLEGTKVTVNAAAPGFVRTEFNKNSSGFVTAILNLGLKLMGSSPADGADAILFVAVAPELEGVTGRLYDRRQQKPGGFDEPGPIAQLEVICDQLVAGGARGPAKAVSDARLPPAATAQPPQPPGG